MTMLSTAFILTISVLYILSPVNAVLLSAGFAAILFLNMAIGRLPISAAQDKEQEIKYL